MSDTLAFTGAGLVFLWGVAHVIPTRQVVAGFGEIGRANRLVLAQEWVGEAFAMWLVAGLVVAVALAGTEGTAHLVYRVCAGFLLVLAAWTAATGARTAVIWFKVCPVLLTTAAALLLAASLT